MGCRWGNLGLGYKEGLRIYDIGPTVLNFFGVESKNNSIGKSLIRA
jgi:predicted AlkP superfamily phosphohydrolase/phosphomutase